MSRAKNVYQLMLTIEVDEASFNSVQDVMDYVRYRLNLRGRNSGSIVMSSIVLLKESNIQMEMEV